jgi:Aspartyl/Asparaginyl beta-hydroxylase
MTASWLGELSNAILPQLMEKNADHTRWLFTMATSEVLRHRTDKFCHFIRMANVDVNEFDEKPDETRSAYLSRKKISVQRETDTIVLRTATYDKPTGLDANRIPNFVWHIHQSEETPQAKHCPKIMKFLYELVDSMRSQLFRAMLVRLSSNKRVYPLFDTGYYYLIRDRYHLVIRSPGGSKMRRVNKLSVWNEGELWWFNSKVAREALNEENHMNAPVVAGQGKNRDL